MDGEWRMTPRQKLVHRPSCFCFLVVLFTGWRRTSASFHVNVQSAMGPTVNWKDAAGLRKLSQNPFKMVILSAVTKSCSWRCVITSASEQQLASEQQHFIFYLFFGKLSTHLLLVITSQICSGHLRLLCSVWMGIILYNTSDHSYLNCLKSSQLSFTGEHISH